jgi:prophage regulatory protein
MAIEFEVVHVFRRRGVAERVGVSIATIDRWVKRGDFPQPIRRGRAVGWRVSEVEAWCAARDRARDAPCARD